MARMGLEQINVAGIWIHRDGQYVVLEAEKRNDDGTFTWCELAREFIDSPFSHIVEPNGIAKKFELVSGEASPGKGD
ncbi:MAG TPA: hypothetical protein VFA74_05680 [Terriglobales bacterium]|nr:hypothetical protein [Terriglobales bacterium]